MKRFLLLLLIVFSCMHAQTFTSKEDKTMLIELYTSEGCSSCPIADKWLGSLKQEDEVFKSFIPLAFHVTYWDFLGWKDSFANVLYDNRQRFYAYNVWQNRSVYTPQFVVNAQEYRAWFNGLQFPQPLNEYGGILKFTLDGKKISVKYKSKLEQSEEVYVHVAILGFDYAIEIKAGENDDRVLKHDFVVLKHHQHFAKINQGELSYQGTLPSVKQDRHKKAVVVWLSNHNHEILQAVGGYL